MLGPKRNGGNLLAELLHEYGFEYVFGVPSEAPEFVAPLWHQGKPRYIVRSRPMCTPASPVGLLRSKRRLRWAACSCCPGWPSR
jgi:hypothetical protein